MPQTSAVLIVEDDAAQRGSLTRFLSHAGLQVREAGTGEEALRQAGHETDLVVLDVQLPDLDGFEVCRRLKAAPGTANVPVLMVSGIATGLEHRVHGLEGGADAYLTKPFHPEELLAQAHALLRLRHAERERDRFFNLSLDLMCSASLDGRFLRVNPAFSKALGYSTEELLSHHYLDFVLPEDHESTKAELGKLAAGHDSFDFENRYRRKKGGFRWLAWTTPAPEPGQRVLFAVARDVTDRKHLEEQLRQSQKIEAVGRLAGGVAHDFNNLLTIINGYGEVLLDRLPASEPTAELVRTMVRAGERAAGLTRQLLAFSRKAVMEPRILDLGTLVRDLGPMLRRIIGEDIYLAVEVDSKVGRVKADPGQIEQVLLNLVVNARDAMPQGGRTTVEVRTAELGEDYARDHADVRPGVYVVLAVSDTGCGMDRETQRHIFEPFFTTKDVGKGTGLGLATVHGIVKQSGGHVAVYSEVNRGSTFKVYLPRVATRELSAGSQETSNPLPRGTETVLMVEDEEGVRGLMGHVLRECGYRVLEASDGAEALRVAQAYGGMIHLLLTDVVMPGMSGHTLSERLQPIFPRAKVLFLSGYTDDAVIRHGILRSDVRFLQKPFTPGSLARKVREALDTPSGPSIAQ